MVWDTVLDNVFLDTDVSEDCSVEYSNNKFVTLDPKCKVEVFGLLDALKLHALSLLKIPGARITAGAGNGQAFLKAIFEPSVKVSFKPSYTKLFDGLPLKFRAEGELTASLKAHTGFHFTCDYHGTTMSNQVGA